MTNFIYSQTIPNEPKICSKGIALFFLSSTQIVFEIFSEILIFFEILLNFARDIA